MPVDIYYPYIVSIEHRAGCAIMNNNNDCNNTNRAGTD
jgi:hypothetical protein